jgi:transcriptional regulator with XRE-family HTH domain
MIGGLVEMNKPNEIDLKEVGARIRNARNVLNLTQAEVAERSFITSRFMSRIETGDKRASADAYRRIATALGITVDDLLYDNAVGIRLQKAFSKEEILDGCTADEKSIIGEMVFTLKELLIRYRRL